jgi:hypothetical protein
MTTCTTPQPLDLIRQLAPAASARRRALLVAACARRFLPWTASEWPHQLVEQFEAIADGRSSKSLDRVLGHLIRLIDSLRAEAESDPRITQHFRVLLLFRALGNEGLANTVGTLIRLVRECIELAEHLDPNLLVRPPRGRRECRRILAGEWAALVSEVLGEPGQVEFAPQWRTPLVLVMSRQAYQGRDFSVLPILADALEDAGCTDEALLSHCRAPGPHARGCWAVDTVLGLE